MEQRIRFLGIDLGSQNLKLVCHLDTSPRHPGIFVTKDGPAPGSLVELGGEPQTLGNALAGLRVQAGLGLKRAPAAVSMPTGAMVVKAVHLPPLSNRERQAAFQLEVERCVPPGEGEVVGDYMPLAPEVDSGGGRNEGYLLLVSSQQLVDALRTALSTARIQPEAVEPEPVTLFRLLMMMVPPGDTGAHVLVDLGASGTRVLVVKDGQLMLFRDLTLGGKHLTAALAQSLGIEQHEAEVLKCSRYQAAESIPELAGAAERLEKEIERSLRYVERTQKIEGYSSLHLVGGGASWPFLRGLVERAVGREAKESVVVSGGQVEPIMAQAAALALYQYEPPKPQPVRRPAVTQFRRAAQGGIEQ